jgi:GH15 family glucan-1,4-alpha-glucosidase
MEHVERVWREADDGIWEARRPRRHYTQSKVMAWVVFDTALWLAERFGLDATVERWKQVRQEIHDEYARRLRPRAQHLHPVLLLEGARRRRPGSSPAPLAARLRPARHRDDHRRPRRLAHDGFISRYSTAETDDGLPGSEGQFLVCSFWLVTALALSGRLDEARALFERPLDLTNDLGLVSEGVRRRPATPGRQPPTGIQSPGADQRRGYDHGRDLSSNRQKHPRILGLI